MGKYLAHPAFIALATLVTVFFYISTSNSIQKYQQSSDSIHVLEKENSQLSDELTTLQQEYEYTQTDFAKEKMIRDELLMQKPGEQVIQLPEDLPPPPSPSPSPSSKPIDEWKALILN